MIQKPKKPRSKDCNDNSILNIVLPCGAITPVWLCSQDMRMYVQTEK